MRIPFGGDVIYRRDLNLTEIYLKEALNSPSPDLSPHGERKK
jgi:hypothetical protein